MSRSWYGKGMAAFLAQRPEHLRFVRSPVESDAVAEELLQATLLLGGVRPVRNAVVVRQQPR